MSPVHKPNEKIPRLYRDCTITEKIDGSHLYVDVPADRNQPIICGSRNRLITLGKETDNYGFAEFVYNNHEQIRRLGPGVHRGEWWGWGINREYGLIERRWSLFTAKPLPEGIPSNIYLVPILHQGAFRTEIIDAILDDLSMTGSIAQKGFMNPEGIVIHHKASGKLFKVTIPNDGHKGIYAT